MIFKHMDGPILCRKLASKKERTVAACALRRMPLVYTWCVDDSGVMIVYCTFRQSCSHFEIRSYLGGEARWLRPEPDEAGRLDIVSCSQ
jgi:hypothetical protein